MTDFELGDALLALQHRVRAFVDADVIPREPEVTVHRGAIARRALRKGAQR